MVQISHIWEIGGFERGEKIGLAVAQHTGGGHALSGGNYGSLSGAELSGMSECYDDRRALIPGADGWYDVHRTDPTDATSTIVQKLLMGVAGGSGAFMQFYPPETTFPDQGIPFGTSGGGDFDETYFKYDKAAHRLYTEDLTVTDDAAISGDLVVDGTSFLDGTVTMDFYAFVTLDLDVGGEIMLGGGYSERITIDRHIPSPAVTHTFPALQLGAYFGMVASGIVSGIMACGSIPFADAYGCFTEDTGFRYFSATDTLQVGKIGVGISAVPHGGIGSAKLAIDGADAAAGGPYVQFTTDSDDYPLFSIVPYQHDSVLLAFDAYYDGTKWRMGDVASGSAYLVGKGGDSLIMYSKKDIAQGGAISGADFWDIDYRLTAETSHDWRLSGTSLLVLTPDSLEVKNDLKHTGSEIGFFSQGPSTRLGPYTQTYSTADRTLGAYTPDNESGAYSGIDNSQGGSVYAQVSDLNALRTAYENLRAFVEDAVQMLNSVVDDAQTYGLFS